MALSRLAGLLHLAALCTTGRGQPMPTTRAQSRDRWFTAGDAEVERRARLLGDTLTKVVFFRKCGENA